MNYAELLIEDIDLFWVFHFIVNKRTYLSDAEEQFIAYTKKTLNKSA